MPSHNRNHEVHRAAGSSVLAALGLTIFKLAIGWRTHSLGLLAEAAHSALDLMAAGITFWAVKISSMPADEDHHYGHGKIENISALIETFLLWVTCGWITYEAIQRFSGKLHPEIEPSIWAFIVLIVSIITDILRSKELVQIAKKYNSQALAADALHFQSDIYSSLAVFIGLIGVYFGFSLGDSIAALIVAGWTFWTSLKLARESIDQLMDKAPEGVEEQIKKILSAIPEVREISTLKVRKSGQIVFIVLTIGLDKNMTFESAHRITDQIEEKIQLNFSQASISVHAEPL
jgi:cation diffusion facilitator family transporter